MRYRQIVEDDPSGAAHRKAPARRSALGSQHIDIVTPRTTPVHEHAFPLSEVRSKLMDRTYQINRHLLLLLAFLPTRERNHWKSELRRWLREIGNWRTRQKGNPPVSAALYLDYLWRGPFEGHATETIENLLRELQHDKPDLTRTQTPVADLAIRLEQWHQQVGARIAAKQPIDDLIGEL